MALESFNAYHSYLKAMEPLNDAERGRLFTACLQYSMTGEAPELRGNERFIFPSMAAQIDRDKEKYEEKCKKQSERAKKRWDASACHGMPMDANGCQRMPERANDAKDKDKDKDKDISPNGDNNPPLSPQGDAGGKRQPKFSARSYVEKYTQDLELRQLLLDWLEVRKKRRAPETERAIRLNLDKLPSMAQESGLSMQEYVAEAVRRGWQAFYPIKDFQPKRRADGRDFDWYTGQ